MKSLVIMALVGTVLMPAAALADDADLHGRWIMVAEEGSTLEDLAQDFHYTFQADGVMVTHTSFAEYEGTWAVDAPGRINLILMSAVPTASDNSCDYTINEDALRIFECSNGGPASAFVRAE